MKYSIPNLVSGALIAGAFLATALCYGALPDAMPTHWNLHGEVDGYMPKPWGPWLMPVMALLLYAGFSVLPRISPRDYGMMRFRRAFEIVRAATIALLVSLHLASLATAFGATIRMERVVPASIGLLFLVLGNYMGKLTRNFFFGIRTPWTLASDEVWSRTHRLGGKLFVFGGLALAGSALVGAGLPVLLIVTAIVALAPVIYSYVIYRRLLGFERGHRPD
jgi:uncharacterized membrane protein